MDQMMVEPTVSASFSRGECVTGGVVCSYACVPLIVYMCLCVSECKRNPK